MGLLPDLSMHRLHHPPHTYLPMLWGCLRSHLLQVLGRQLRQYNASCASTKTLESGTVTSEPLLELAYSWPVSEIQPANTVGCDSSLINICKTEPQFLQKKGVLGGIVPVFFGQDWCSLWDTTVLLTSTAHLITSQASSWVWDGGHVFNQDPCNLLSD